MFRIHLRKCVVLLLLAGLCPFGAAQEAQPQPSDYGILIVGDEADGEMLRREKVLIQEMAKTRKQKLPICSYHFNKEAEKSYCEKKLNILREDLLFVGVVAMKDRVPRKVLYRLDRINNPSRSARDVTTRAEEIVSAAATPTASPSPDASATPTPPVTPPAPPQTATTTTGGWRVQLGSFTHQTAAQDLVNQLKGKGYDAKIDKVAEQYKVWVGSFATKEDAVQALGNLKNDGFDKGFATEHKP